jgi:hypothetical protein
VTADSRAFATLIRHLKEVDRQHTVITVQVENETGLLGDSQDGSPAANEAFQRDVPPELVQFLNRDWEKLHPDLQTTLSPFKQQQDQSNRLWE